MYINKDKGVIRKYNATGKVSEEDIGKIIKIRELIKNEFTLNDLKNYINKTVDYEHRKLGDTIKIGVLTLVLNNIVDEANFLSKVINYKETNDVDILDLYTDVKNYILESENLLNLNDLELYAQTEMPYLRYDYIIEMLSSIYDTYKRAIKEYNSLYSNKLPLNDVIEENKNYIEYFHKTNLLGEKLGNVPNKDELNFHKRRRVGAEDLINIFEELPFEHGEVMYSYLDGLSVRQLNDMFGKTAEYLRKLDLIVITHAIENILS